MFFEDRQSIVNIRPPGLFVLALVLGGILAAIVLVLPPTMSLLILAAAIAIPIIAKRPEFALLGMLVLSSTIFEEQYTPKLDVGPLQVYASDLILIFLFVLVLYKWITDAGYKFANSPVSLPLVVFFGISMVATLVGFFRSPGSELNFAEWLRNPPVFISQAIPEIRIIFYYLGFFAVVNLIRTKSQIKTLAFGMVILCALIVVVMVIQEILGTSAAIMPGRVEILVTGEQAVFGVTRMAGFSGEKLLLFGLSITTVLLVYQKIRINQLFLLSMWGFIFVGILMTFSRSIIGGYFVELVVLYFLSKPEIRARLSKLVLLLSVMGLIVVGLFYLLPENRVQVFFQASVDRVVSIFNPETYTSTKETVRWREFEYTWGSRQIVLHPLLGMGLGARYRPYLPEIDREVETAGRTFFHNSHLWMIVKMGLLGFFAFLWFLIIYCRRGVDYVLSSAASDETMTAIVLGCVLTFIGFFVGSVTSPMFMRYSSGPVIGIMLGLGEAVFLLNSHKSKIK